MKTTFIFCTTILTVFLASCVPGESGNSERYSFVNRRQAVMVGDNETGEIYRMLIKKDGTTKWESLGSPDDVK